MNLDKLTLCKRCGGKTYLIRFGISNQPERFPCPDCAERLEKLKKMAVELGLIDEPGPAKKTLTSHALLAHFSKEQS